MSFEPPNPGLLLFKYHNLPLQYRFVRFDVYMVITMKRLYMTLRRLGEVY
jgi:predicted CDP-diglyceride synthetase/phosphatidate cytidylyltransferase